MSAITAHATPHRSGLTGNHSIAPLQQRDQRPVRPSPGSCPGSRPGSWSGTAARGRSEREAIAMPHNVTPSYATLRYTIHSLTQLTHASSLFLARAGARGRPLLLASLSALYPLQVFFRRLVCLKTSARYLVALLPFRLVALLLIHKTVPATMEAAYRPTHSLRGSFRPLPVSRSDFLSQLHPLALPCLALPLTRNSLLSLSA